MKKTKKAHVSKRLSSIRHAGDAEALYDVLEKRGDEVLSADALAKELGKTKEVVRSLVAEARRKYRAGDENFPNHIILTRGGWTLDEKAEHVAYETRFRMCMGFGVLANGQPVYKALKKLSYDTFKGLRIEFQPKIEAVRQLTQK